MGSRQYYCAVGFRPMNWLVWSAVMLVSSTAFGAELRTYPDPFEQSVAISGHIDPSVSYHFTVEVTYVAQAKLKSCQTRNWIEGVTSQQGITDHIAPVVEADHYLVRVPLKRYDPTTACQWKPALVAFCQRSDRSVDCGSVLILTEDRRNQVSKMTILCLDNGHCGPNAREGIAAASAGDLKSLEVDIVRKN